MYITLTHPLSVPLSPSPFSLYLFCLYFLSKALYQSVSLLLSFSFYFFSLSQCLFVCMSLSLCFISFVSHSTSIDSLSFSVSNYLSKPLFAFVSIFIISSSVCLSFSLTFSLSMSFLCIYFPLNCSTRTEINFYIFERINQWVFEIESSCYCWPLISDPSFKF